MGIRDFYWNEGVDRYIGSSKNELVTYEEEGKDRILGLFLTDNEYH